MTEDECQGFGGTYQGNGVVCVAETCVASGVVDALIANGGIQAAPNPSSERMTITFVLRVRAWTTAHIHDAAGRLIRTLGVGMRESGFHALEWDGRADTGDQVRAGIYFARVVSGAVVLRERVVRW
ncbi:MAG: hypothetical protein IT360_12900 [Gemmatimonadaceae bacterium]|nr:hypothetical protein [Gemmatimonadaceae bacterium]